MVSVTDHAPLLSVVPWITLPVAQATLMVPFAIGVPTAATPLNALLPVPPPLPEPPLHAVSKAPTRVKSNAVRCAVCGERVSVTRFWIPAEIMMFEVHARLSEIVVLK